MKLKKTPIKATISFDYELAWGVWDKVPASYLASNVAHENRAAKKIIELHKALRISSTWAVVGLTLQKDIVLPALLDSGFLTEKDRRKLPVLEEVFDNFRFNLVYTEPDLIERLSSAEFEIASHTFGHLYMLEAEEADIENDFSSMESLFSDKGLAQPRSIIFPKNQVTDYAITVAKRFGFRFVRVSPDNFLYRTKNHSRWLRPFIRVLRYIDSFLPLNELIWRASAPQNSGMDATVGNIFFRPDCGNAIADYLHFKRVVLGLLFCKFTGRNFHMWTHPHNFGVDVERSMRNYERILLYLRKEEVCGNVVFRKMDELQR